MKKIVLLSAVLCGLLFAHEGHHFDPKAGKHLVIEMNELGEKGDKKVGEVVAVETNYGVAFFPDLKGIKSGIHGFHVHQNPDCGATEKRTGHESRWALGSDGYENALFCMGRQGP